MELKVTYVKLKPFSTIAQTHISFITDNR